MTTSTWDKSEIVKQFSACRNLQEVIAQLEQDFSGRGEVICEIRVNGLLLAESDETRFAQSRLDEISTLAIASERPDELVRDALGSAHEYMSRMRAACEQTADLFRGTETKKAQARFAEIIDGCQWLVETISGIRSTSESLGRALVDRTAWLKAENRFVEVVEQIHASYKNRDFVLVADVLEYELFNVLENWAGVLRQEHEARR